MDEVFKALGQPLRIAILGLLARCGPDGLQASEIARITNTTPNNLSAHLAILSRANLIISRKRGRAVLSSIRLDTVRQAARFLLFEFGEADLPLLEEFARDLASTSQATGQPTDGRLPSDRGPVSSCCRADR